MDLTEVRSGAMKSSLLVWKMIMGECRPWLVTSLLIYVAKIKHFLVQDSTCAAAATEKVRTPESNPLFVRLFSGFCYFSPDTAPHNLIFAPVSNVRGNNYKKAARVPVSVSPRPAQYFISDIKDAAWWTMTRAALVRVFWAPDPEVWLKRE